MDGSIKIVRQLEKVFEPCWTMFRELKGGRGGEATTIFLLRNEQHEKH
jgi:hypothetical protein